MPVNIREFQSESTQRKTNTHQFLILALHICARKHFAEIILRHFRNTQRTNDQHWRLSDYFRYLYNSWYASDCAYSIITVGCVNNDTLIRREKNCFLILIIVELSPHLFIFSSKRLSTRKIFSTHARIVLKICQEYNKCKNYFCLLKVITVVVISGDRHVQRSIHHRHRTRGRTFSRVLHAAIIWTAR